MLAETHKHKWDYSIDLLLSCVRTCKICGARQQYNGGQWIELTALDIR